MIFVVGAALVGISTALNAISLHGTCTAVFVVVAAVATYPFAAMRTLEKIRWVGWAGLASMVVSVRPRPLFVLPLSPFLTLFASSTLRLC
jgi:hypothetical protein